MQTTRRTSTATTTVGAPRPHHALPAGEQSYTIIRWLNLLLLLLWGSLVHNQFPWELSPTSPTLLILLAYVVLALVTSAGLFVSLLAPLFAVAPFGEMLLIAALCLFSGAQSATVAVFALFPLARIATRFPPLYSLGVGVGSAILFAVAIIFGSSLPESSSTTQGGVDGLLTGAVLVLHLVLPWLVSTLHERSGSTNRQQVEAAQQAAQQEIEQAQQTMQASRQRVQWLHQIASTLAAMDDTTPGQKRVLNTVLEQGQQLLPYATGLILRKGAENGGLLVEAGHQINPRDLGTSISITADGKLAALLQATAKPTLIKDIQQDADLQALASLHSCRTAWVVPIVSGAVVYGLLILGTDQPDTFQPEQQDMLATLAGLSSVALRNAQLLAELHPHRERLMKSEARAREELTRHVHDGLAQTLAQIVMNLDVLKRLVGQDPASALKELDTLHQQYKRFHFEVREVLTALSPLPLGQGLYPILKQFLERKQQHYQETRFTFEAESIKGLSLHYNIENMLYNIVQESVNNALKYAEASHIRVRCETNGSVLTLSITDNGKGFDVEQEKEAARKRGSFGMFNIDERARLAGGSAEIRSVIGKGAFIRVSVPVRSKDESEETS